MDEFNQNNPQENTNTTGEQQNPVQGDPHAQQNVAQNDPYAQQNYTQPNYYQQPQADPYSYQQPEKPKQGMAIASLVFGILSLVLFCVPFLPVVLAIVALILGIIPLIKKTGGKGLAIAGVICGGIGLVWGVYMAISMIVVMSDPNFTNIWDSMMQQYQ